MVLTTKNTKHTKFRFGINSFFLIRAQALFELFIEAQNAHSSLFFFRVVRVFRG